MGSGGLVSLVVHYRWGDWSFGVKFAKKLSEQFMVLRKTQLTLKLCLGFSITHLVLCPVEVNQFCFDWSVVMLFTEGHQLHHPPLSPIFYSQCFPFSFALWVTANEEFLVKYWSTRFKIRWNQMYTSQWVTKWHSLVQLHDLICSVYQRANDVSVCYYLVNGLNPGVSVICLVWSSR